MHYSVALLITIFSFLGHAAPNEDRVFDQNFKAPLETFLHQYQTHQILALGTSGHDNYKIFSFLSEVLREVGEDPRLKFIVLESFSDNHDFYRTLSLQELPTALRLTPFPSPLSQDNSLCGGSQFAYTIAHLFPELRAINHRRGSPLLATTVDGTMSERDWTWPDVMGPILPGNCEISDEQLPIYAASAQREMDTAKNFETRIWKNLGPQDKAIVIYHSIHLLKGFQSCLPSLENGKWRSYRTQLSWFDHFLSANPSAEARSSIILFDEVDLNQSPYGGFNFGIRQSQRHPGLSYGVPLDLFAEIFTETGLAALHKDAMLQTYQGGNHISALNLSEMADAYIWEAKTLGSEYRTPHDYLPDYCAHSDGSRKRRSN